MALSVEEIDVLVKEARELLAGRAVRKIYHKEPHELFLAFRAQGSRVFLFFTARPRTSRFHLLWEAPSFPPRPSPFCERLRAVLSGKRLADIRRYGENRAVLVTFHDSPFSLVGEFFGNRGNVILLEGGRYVDSLHPVVRRRRVLRPGQAYELPPGRSPSISRQHPRYLITGEAGPYPYSRGLAGVMASRELELDFESRRGRLLGLVRRKQKRLERLLGKLSEEKEAASRAEIFRKWGEALKYHLHELPKGGSQIELPDPFEPGARLVVPLDPALPPRRNMELYFQKYRKLRDSLPHINERYEQCAAELNEVRDTLVRLSELSWEREEDQRALEQLASRLEKAPPGPERLPARPRSSGRAVRRFELRGHSVWVGRSARENTALVREIARGNDFFLHISGRPGAVVIVRAPSGKATAPEALQDAALLAAHYSGGEAGGVYEVDYTQVKYVRPIKGETGRFSMAKRRSLRVRLERDRLSAILRRALHHEPAG